MNKTSNVSIFLAIPFVIVLLLLPFTSLAYGQVQPEFFSQNFTIKTNQKVFVPGDTLILYGKAEPRDGLLAKVLDPAGKAVRLENIPTSNDGSFTAQMFTWPPPSKNFVFGAYNVEVSSSRFPTDKVSIPITFAEETGRTDAVVPHTLEIKLDSPTEVSTGKPFRIFMQTTFDGELVKVDNPDDMLASSHIHSGDTIINLAGQIKELHEGIYYADVILDKDGTYIIHAIAFYKGFRAHDSKVVSSGTSIGDIRQSVDTLRAELDKTSQDLNDTRTSVTKSVEDARAAIKGDVDNLQSASGQINSLILPILALISIIIALQISLFARIRASFK
jgi:hypothetical protein